MDIHHRASERGVILVFVAIAMLVLLAFLTFVVDYGIMWVSRGQAQNSADAGALAGAVARGFDDLSVSNPPATTRPQQSALLAAAANPVWGVAPVAQVSWTCPPGVLGSCVRVDVYRNGQFGSAPLAMRFGRVLNIATQGIRATATARVGAGNAVNCMRPWAVADLWDPVVPNTPEVFNRWVSKGGNAVELSPHDRYAPADVSGAGTGFRLPRDFGMQEILKGGNNPNSSIGAISPGWFLPVRLPDGAGGFSSGGDEYRDAISMCIGNPVRIGQYLPTESGAMIGPTGQGFDDLWDDDPSASWDVGTNSVIGSCAPSCAPFSPRIVPITVFDMDEFQWRKEANDWTTEWLPGVGPGTNAVPGGVCPTGGGCVRVANILGFFVDSMSGNDVVGYLMSYPGEFIVGAPALGGGAAFLQAIQLVR